ncbi:RNA polymerase sigma factor SigE [Kitasatospora cathayae]|uniref:RNA polymerase sigma factor SigE n=2 Tax=Kitasatospora cathayae TaxID=3004092 RepID=A0ABY7QFU5_9ACTN|nr:RNA polymerase sigma factor SigE [Kitasatospora sp. HUAS 3-15]WBP91618.1 RNA polymerase sigma factor SigE [Kitasatospora sp. HUAS 3-15]
MVVALLGRRADRGGVAEGDVPVRRHPRGTASARTPKPVMNQPAHSDLDQPAAETSAAGTTEAPVLATFAEGPDAQTWTPPTWEEIVEAHSARVYRLAYRLTGNQHDAEDLTQEVFVRVFRSLSTYTPGTFEGWLHRITTNLFLDMVRRRQRIRFDALGEDAAERLASREPSPAQHFSDTHFDADVQQALDTLAPEFRAAVVLCDIEGLSYEEIAATLGVKLGTVRSRIHRGRSHLRAALKHRAPGSAPGRERRGGSEEPVPVGAVAEVAAAPGGRGRRRS